MVNYLRNYGKHFNKKMYDFAVSTMYKERNGKKERITPVTKEQFDTVTARHGIKLENDAMYDGVYVWSMGMADYSGQDIVDFLNELKAMN